MAVRLQVLSAPQLFVRRCSRTTQAPQDCIPASARDRDPADQTSASLKALAHLEALPLKTTSAL